jgi:hypothetical protein
LGKYHRYGTLLGTNIFNTFINGIVTYRTLTRPQFSQLQQRLFPYYFAIQSLAPCLLALSWPAPRGSWTQPTHIPDGLVGSLSTPGGTRTGLVLMVVLGFVNWFVFGPMTTQCIRERKRQETRDGKKYWEKGEQTQEMVRLNKRFGVLHGISSLVNVVDIGVCIWYGVILAARL